MTSLDPRAQMTLELSRLTQEPSAADRARNLAALRDRLGLPVPGARTTAEPTTAPEPAPAPELAPGAAALRHSHPTQPLPQSALGGASAAWAQLAAVGAISATLGVLVGLSINRSAPSADPFSLPIGSIAAPSSVALEPRTEAPPSPAGESAVAASPAASPSAPDAESRKLEATVHARRSRAAERAPPLGRPHAPEFLDAVRLLRRARSALQKGEARLSLGLLDELDARFPRAMLDEERGATRVLALCANDEIDAARRLATRLLADYPRSIYAHRLEQSCAGESGAASRNR
jgi:hypothetical protein